MGDLPELAFYMVGDIKEVQSKARTMAGSETKEDKAEKSQETDYKEEDVSEESLAAFAKTVYEMYEEQCAEEINSVAEFPEEVARLKSKWLPAVQSYAASKGAAEAKN